MGGDERGQVVGLLPSRASQADRLAAARSAASRAQLRHGGMPGARTLSTLPALAPLLPGGGLRTGATYSVLGSTSLAMAMLAGPSAAGGWGGVLGLPGFGVEAAAAMGVDLDKLVLVPDPGPDPWAILGALVDALQVVVVGDSSRLGAGTGPEAARLGARLRQREAVLVVCGPWPQCEATLSVSGDRWLGLGTGHGHLTARSTTVTVRGRGAGRPVSAPLWLPDAHGVVSPAGDVAAEVAPLLAEVAG